MRRWAILVVGLWLVGCANIDRYYTPEAGSFPPTSNVALVDGGQDAEAVYGSSYRTGYQRVGHLNYVGDSLSDDRIADLGRRVGADVAIIARVYHAPRVVESGRDIETAGDQSRYGLNPTSGAEPGFSPSTINPEPPRTYVVREYRVTAIFLRRATPRS